ncbi:hypothetical protein VNI00_006760 [Paramarasmius palmivorus]|uniref:Uncharacterized protein n=1 Tax=Paramarasmius palmivorus TaxID=297713 RepID=A0AAW0D9P9_9AGAR
MSLSVPTSMLRSFYRTVSVSKSSGVIAGRAGLALSRTASSTRVFPSLSQIPHLRLLNETTRTFTTSPRRTTEPDPVTPAFVFPADELLKALELTAKTTLPPIPPSEDKEAFWRAYLLSNQIILYLGARPPAEAEAFSSVLQAGTVAPDSPVARGRASLEKVSKMIIEAMSYLPQDSKLRAEHPDVIEVYERFAFTVESYGNRERKEEEFDLDAWSRFYVGLRTEVVQFAVMIGKVVEKWE